MYLFKHYNRQFRQLFSLNNLKEPLKNYLARSGVVEFTKKMLIYCV